MELSGNISLAQLFNRLSTMNPKSFDEFDRVVGTAVGKELTAYKAVKSEYTISAPPNLPFAEEVPDKGVLFGGNIEVKTEPVRFQFILDKGGLIAFSAYFEEGKSVSSEERQVLNAIFGWLNNMLNEVININTYKKLVMVDPATGMNTQAAFMQFAGMLTATGRSREYTALYFNIRNFKSIDKVLNFVEGNTVMAKYCQTLINALSSREMVARMGGDNFVALIFDEHRDYFFDLIQNMIIKFSKDGKNYSFSFGATIGATKLADEKNPGEIMMHIISAYQAAREKRMVLSYYDKKINLDIMEKKIILSKFHKALNDREFFAMYQPKVDTRTHMLVGAEALVRWRRESGFIMPASFVSILEKDGCICALDFYMLETVCKLQRRLFDSGIEPVKISVNFSKRHLSNNKLVEEIVEVIDRYQIPHNLIEVELTESEDYHNQGVIKDIVEELSILGIKSSIDDFGTGYSSLGMLRTLHLNELKIDKSFIPEKFSKEYDKTLVMLRGVVSLAKSLGLTIVAEGVETREQLALIEDLGCDAVQGYIFDKPLTESDFIDRLKRKYYN